MNAADGTDATTAAIIAFLRQLRLLRSYFLAFVPYVVCVALDCNPAGVSVVQVLHLMRCPSGLVWDNVHKLCMESSSTCHGAALQAGADPSTSVDSYMQYFAKLAAAAQAAAPDDALTQPRLKTADAEDSSSSSSQ